MANRSIAAIDVGTTKICTIVAEVTPLHELRILGVGIAGRGAGELIGEATLAVEMGARVDDLCMTIHAHPTLSETLMEAAETFFGTSPHYMSRRR